MSSGCGDVVTLEALQTAKKHQIFEAEVITGLLGGVAGGAAIDFATNPVTMRVQKTLPAVLRDAGFRPAPFTFTTGGTLAVNDADLAVLWPISDGGDGNYYAWKGSLPKVIPASSTPNTTGGISASAWVPVTEAALRRDLATSAGVSMIGTPFNSMTLLDLINSPHVVTPQMYGVAGGGQDSTRAMQAALDYLESVGGGTLMLPPGVYYVSLAQSNNANACVVIPANIRVQGSGVGVTTIQRLPAERGVNGVLLVNKGWDTMPGFTASGNITLRDFTITDGAQTPNRILGDLIGLGHSHDVLVDSVQSLNHDQHFLDICGSTDVKVVNCTGFCDLGGSATTYNSTVQIDAAWDAAMMGIYVDGTASQKVTISNNNFTNKTCNVMVQVGHAEGYYRKIVVADNILDACYVSDSSVIGCDATLVSLSEVAITGNVMTTNNVFSRGANFYSSGANETLISLLFCNNTIRGPARLGAWFGTNSTYAGSTIPHGSLVANNNQWLITTAASGTHPQMVTVAGWQSAIFNSNTVTIVTPGPHTAGCEALLVGRNSVCKVNGNSFGLILSGGSIDYTLSTTSGILLDPYLANATNGSMTSITNNTFFGSGFKYLINHSGATGTWVQGTDIIKVSGNDARLNHSYIGTVGAHMYETYPISDGTNFEQLVSILGQTRRQLFQLNTYASTFTLKKNGNVVTPAKVTFRMNTAVASLTGGEEINTVYLSATTSVGVTANTIDLTTGTMNVVTGTSGVSMTLNPANSQPLIRNGVFVSATIGI